MRTSRCLLAIVSALVASSCTVGEVEDDVVDESDQGESSFSITSPQPAGVLTDFYRGTQLQGLFPGMGLMDIPECLLAADIDIRYRLRNPASRREIPFVSSFTINRFLGGHLISQGKDFRDYVTRDAAGAYVFHPEIIGTLLQPYLDAGYGMKDMTIMIENTPWALARLGGTNGAFGQKEPPDDWARWSYMIDHFAAELKRRYPGLTRYPDFKIGNEFDAIGNFNGTQTDFFTLYARAREKLAAAFPASVIGPGEYTGTGEGGDGRVYDSLELLDYLDGLGAPAPFLVRSLHDVLNATGAGPSRVINRAIAGYTRLRNKPTEIHQMGILFQRFGTTFGSDVGSLQANFEFQVLFGLKRAFNPRRVFHWQTIAEYPVAVANGNVALLNGSGFVRLLLDQYLGFQVTMLPATADVNVGTEVMGVGLSNGTRSAIVVSSFNVDPSAPGSWITVTVPAALLAGKSLSTSKYLAYTRSNSIFQVIREELDAANNLKPEFHNAPYATAGVDAMAIDYTRAKQMLHDRWAAYEASMKGTLRWKSLVGSSVVVFGTGQVRVWMAPNTLLVIQ
jgi:hypothetical protein